MSKTKITTAIAAVAMLGSLTTVAIPTASVAQQRFGSGVINCDAPGGRQQVGAAIGAVLGGIVGSNVARNERTLGTVVGAGAGAAAGSYIGCNQQRARAAQAGYGSEYTYGAGAYRATSNLNVRSGPGTNYLVVSRLSAGQPFSIEQSQGEWVQIAGGGWVNANYVTTN